MPKVTGNNRTSALNRLSKPYSVNNLNRSSSVNDARQLLANRNKASFDARQLLSRKATSVDDSDGNMVVVTGLKDMKMKDGRLISSATGTDNQLAKKKTIFASGPSTLVTIRNNNPNPVVTQSSEKFSFTKTIKNPSVRLENEDRRSQTTNTLSSSTDQKVVISFVNDKYQNNPTPPPITTTRMMNSSSPLIHRRNSPPVIKRLHDASIQTISSSSSSRSPIRMSTHRRQHSTMTDDEDYSSERTIGDDFYEPPVKRTTSFTRKTTTDKEPQLASTAVSTGSLKRTSTGASVSSRMTSSVAAVSKKATTTQSASTPGTILVTNLQSSVTEDDVIELFGQIGRISEIKTLSQGCVQITYAKREHSEQAVTKYHNRLLDGQFMYVSLQQLSSQPTPTVEKPKPIQTSKTTSNTQQSTRENGTSASSSSTTNQPLKFNTTASSSTKTTLDASFIRQALFHPSNNSTNPVQFQVKL